MKNPKIKPDIIFKEFWRQNDRFASLFNTVVFEGEEVIKPEELSELDTDVSTMVEFNEYKETLSRARDVVKKAAHGVDFVIMGIENQRKTHYGMPLRVMIYDALGYLKEYQEISRKHRPRFLNMKKVSRVRSTGTMLLYADIVGESCLTVKTERS